MEDSNYEKIEKCDCCNLKIKSNRSIIHKSRRVLDFNIINKKLNLEIENLEKEIKQLLEKQCCECEN